MEELYAAYEKATEYPRNLIRQRHFANILESYIEKLRDREDALFEEEDDEAELDFWEAATRDNDSFNSIALPPAVGHPLTGVQVSPPNEFRAQPS